MILFVHALFFSFFELLLSNPVQPYVSPVRIGSTNNLRPLETSCDTCMRIMRSYDFCKLHEMCKDYTTTSSTTTTTSTTTEVYLGVLNENEGVNSAENLQNSPITLRGSGMVQCSPCRGLLGKVTCMIALPECKLKKSLPECQNQCIGYVGCIVQSIGDYLFGETCTPKKEIETPVTASSNVEFNGGSGDINGLEEDDYGSAPFDIDIYENSGMPQNYVDPDYYENSGNSESGNTDREELLINFQNDENDTRGRNNLEQLFS